MILPLTLSLASAAILLNIWLAARVSRLRYARGITIGDGGDPALIARMRAQANYVEHAPFFLILLAAVELGGGRPLWLWAIGAIFFLARILHALGMDGGTKKRLRSIGMIATTAAQIALVVYALVIVATAHKPAPSITYASAAAGNAVS
jgi:hypothetical protein